MVAECFLSAVEDPAAVVAEIRRVLRSGGRLVLSDMYLRNQKAAAFSAAPPRTCLEGATSIDTTLALLHQTGFTVRHWQARSDALKALTISLIFAYGSTADFFRAAGGEDDVQAHLDQVRAARPGYFTLVADATLPAVSTRPCVG